MEALEKQIAGDWYDVRQALDDRFKYEEVLEMSDEQVGELLQSLRLSVEQGTLELKRRTINRVLGFVDSQQFDARSFGDIPLHIQGMRSIAYLALLQRAFCLGTLSPRKTPAPPPPTMEEAVKQLDIQTILAKVQERIAQDQTQRDNPPVKSILVQVSRYRLELKNMKELAPNIPKEKSAAFSANFKKTFDEITRKIQDNYAAILQAEQKPEKPAVRRKMFERFELKPLGGFFGLQVQEFTRIRTVLSYAQKERFKIREILSDILARRQGTLALVERELKEYERFSYGHGEELAREFAAEVAEYLGRRMSPPPEDEEWI